MSGKKLYSISEFEWASVAQYVVYISSIANLNEISSNDVVSFPLARLGPKKLVLRKKRALRSLEENISRLERFVGRRGKDLGKYELSVLRGLYIQYRGNIETVRHHLETAKLYKEAQATGFFQDEEGGRDDPVF